MFNFNLDKNLSSLCLEHQGSRHRQEIRDSLHLSIDLYSHFTICPTTQDGMTKRYGEALVFPQTVQQINHTLA